MKAWSLGNFFSSFAVPVGLQKRLLSFLLRKAIGHFLEDDLDLEKLDIELSNGIVHLTDLKLNTAALNDLAAGAPLTVSKGHIKSITATIPWRNLWSGQALLKIVGIDITLEPVRAQSNNVQDLEDQLLSSSVNLANDFLYQHAPGKDEQALKESLLQTFQAQAAPTTTRIPGDFNTPPRPSDGTAGIDDFGDVSDGEGIQLVAKLIEKLMARIQVVCEDITIRLRHSSKLPLVKSQARGANTECRDYEVEIRLPYIAYRDESPGWDQSVTGAETPNARSSYTSDSVASSTMLEESVIPSVIWQDTAESIKTVVFKGFSIWIRQLDEQGKAPVPTDSTIKSGAKADENQATSRGQNANSDSDSDSDVFSDARDSFSYSVMASQVRTSRTAPRLAPPSSSVQEEGLYEAAIVTSLQHKNRVKISVRKNASIISGGSTLQALPSAKSVLDVDVLIRSFLVALSPNQVAFIMEILDLMESAPSAEKKEKAAPPTPLEQERPSDSGRGDFVNPESQGYAHEYSSRARAGSNAGRMQYNQGLEPTSPRPPSTLDQTRSSATKSPGGRTTDHARPFPEYEDRSRDARVMHSAMDSSRFLDGSIYSGHRSRPPVQQPFSTTAPPLNATSELTMKLKAKISTIQIFMLHQDPLSLKDIPEAYFFKKLTPEALEQSHFKIELDNVLIRFQQWRTSPNGGQRGSRTKKSQLDFTLNNFKIAEWITASSERTDFTRWNEWPDQYRVPPRRQYIPLVEFNTDLDTPLSVPLAGHFPTLNVPDRYLTAHAISQRSRKAQKSTKEATSTTANAAADLGSGVQENPTGTTKEVIRMRVLLGGKKDDSRSSNPSVDSSTASTSTHSSGYAQDVTVEVKPFQVHLDLYTLVRLESYLIVLMGPGRKPPTPANKPSNQGACLQPPTEQQIFDDLDAPQRVAKSSARLRLRLNSVQIWISVPDMATTLSGVKDTGPEYRSIYDLIAVNISKLVVTHGSDLSRGSSSANEDVGHRFNRTSDDNSTKFKVDFTNLSAFVIPANEYTSKAILSVGSLPTQAATNSGYSSSMPLINITIRSPSSFPVRCESSNTSELRAFAIMQDEENAHSAEDERENLDRFRMATSDYSLVVIDTQIPLVAVRLHKTMLDTLQLRLNDVNTWVALFTASLDSKLPATPSTMESSFVTDWTSQDRYLQQRLGPSDSINSSRVRSSLDGGPRDDQSEQSLDQSRIFGEELRRQASSDSSLPPQTEYNNKHTTLPSISSPTMASIHASIQAVDVVVDYPKSATALDPEVTKSYRINVGDARAFLAVKYQGGSETCVIVDAEELEISELKEHKEETVLLTRMIRKPIKVKNPAPMFHMTSLLSFDPVILFKQNDTKLAFFGITWKFTFDQTAVDDIQDFFAEPAGIVYWNLPKQCTRVHVCLSECGLDYKPMHLPSYFALSFEKMKVFATLIPESSTLKSRVTIYNMAMFLIDSEHGIQSQSSDNKSGPGIDSHQYWKSLGFAQIGQCRFFQLNSVKSKTGQLPLYDLTITNDNLYLETCKDSFETLVSFAGYLGDNGDMPIEKKRILERLAEEERAANRAKSNVIYQDVLVASLDEDAFRKPKDDRASRDSSGLEIVEGFYAVEKEDGESDQFRVQIQESPNVDGFHEIYTDLSFHDQDDFVGSIKPDDVKRDQAKSSKISHTSLKQALSQDVTGVPLLSSSGKSHATTRQLSLDESRREDYLSRSGPTLKKETFGQDEGIVRVLDQEAQFLINENYFSVPVLTEEEMVRKDGSFAKLRLRIKDFGFSLRLYDGLDWATSRLDETERKRQARQIASRLHDPNDSLRMALDSAQSNIEASIFERLSGLPSVHDHRKDLSPSSSEADSTVDYQNDASSQFNTGGRSSSTSSVSGGRRRPSQLHQPSAALLDPSGHTHRQPRKKNLERSKSALIEFNATKVRLDFEDYIAGIEMASHLSLRVKEFEIIDNVKTSLWHKFLSQQRPDSHTATPRLMQSSMVRLDLDGVRPVVSASTVEYRLKARILPLRLYVDQDALIFLIKFFVQGSNGSIGQTSTDPPENKNVPVDPVEKKKPNELYFQSVKLGEMSVKVDYKPKHVDYTGLSGGNFVELMNFFHLEAAEMTLQEVELHGVNGFTKLAQDLVACWLPHIRSTQVPHMVSGLTPIRSLVNLGSGIADLVLLPIEQYKRDGHIIRGLQKGGQAFTRATTLEALKIGTKLAVGTQVLLEHADEIFGGGRPGKASSSKSRQGGAEGSEEASDDHYSQYSGGSVKAGKRVVATMVSDSEALMQESTIEDEEQFLRDLQQQHQPPSLYQHPLSDQPGSSSTAGPSTTNNKISKYAYQPADLNEGMEHAYRSLSKNLGTAAHTIFAVPMEVYEQAGAQGSVRAVIRAVPVAVLKPMIGATEAFSKVLIGIRNSIDPGQKLEMEDKYKQ